MYSKETIQFDNSLIVFSNLAVEVETECIVDLEEVS